MRTLCCSASAVSFVFIAIAACANVETSTGSRKSQESDVEEVVLDPATQIVTDGRGCRRVLR